MVAVFTTNSGGVFESSAFQAAFPAGVLMAVTQVAPIVIHCLITGDAIDLDTDPCVGAFTVVSPILIKTALGVAIVIIRLVTSPLSATIHRLSLAVVDRLATPILLLPVRLLLSSIIVWLLSIDIAAAAAAAAPSWLTT